ncbi:MAG: hypothetical protein PHP57_04150 [Sideroxydans sp.]|nr:hypothetical protein [Sideroxydans sp.]
MKAKIALVVFIMATFAAEVFAENATIPGAYEMEGAGGTLMVTGNEENHLQEFVIDTWGGNGHTCTLAGKMKGNLGVVDDDSDMKGDECTFLIESKADRISVSVSPEMEDSCRYYCGASAGFAGDYFTVDPYCKKTEDIRAEFLNRYETKNYEKAKNILAELLKRCERFMDWHNQAEVRNDLAVTELHLGDKKACLKTLQPIKPHFVDDPFESHMGFAPIDEEWGAEMTKTTRFNWQKCGGKLPKYSQTKVD